MYYDSTFKFQIYGYCKLNIDIDIEKKIFLASTIEKIPIFQSRSQHFLETNHRKRTADPIPINSLEINLQRKTAKHPNSLKEIPRFQSRFLGNKSLKISRQSKSEAKVFHSEIKKVPMTTVRSRVEKFPIEGHRGKKSLASEWSEEKDARSVQVSWFTTRGRENGGKVFADNVFIYGGVTVAWRRTRLSRGHRGMPWLPAVNPCTRLPPPCRVTGVVATPATTCAAAAKQPY